MNCSDVAPSKRLDLACYTPPSVHSYHPKEAFVDVHLLLSAPLDSSKIPPSHAPSYLLAFSRDTSRPPIPPLFPIAQSLTDMNLLPIFQSELRTQESAYKAPSPTVPPLPNPRRSVRRPGLTVKTVSSLPTRRSPTTQTLEDPRPSRRRSSKQSISSLIGASGETKKFRSSERVASVPGGAEARQQWLTIRSRQWGGRRVKSGAPRGPPGIKDVVVGVGGGAVGSVGEEKYAEGMAREDFAV